MNGSVPSWPDSSSPLPYYPSMHLDYLHRFQMGLPLKTVWKLPPALKGLGGAPPPRKDPLAASPLVLPPLLNQLVQLCFCPGGHQLCRGRPGGQEEAPTAPFLRPSLGGTPPPDIYFWCLHFLGQETFLSGRHWGLILFAPSGEESIKGRREQCGGRGCPILFGPTGSPQRITP